MKILFLHNNFPAQYRWLSAYLGQDKSNQVLFGSIYCRYQIPNVKNVHYQPARKINPNTPPHLINAEKAIISGEGAFNMAMQLKKSGFIPDIICAHAGWGPGHFMKEVYPDTPLLSLFEWFYNFHNSDINFFPDHQTDAMGACRLRIKNDALLTDLNACDWGICPTEWQASQLPVVYIKNIISVIHDGIHTEAMLPNPKSKCILQEGKLDLSGVDEIVTYVARGMEEYRGFMQFMEAVAILQKQRPKTHFVVVGEDRVAYGKTLPNKQTFKQKALKEFEFDHDRLHFTGLLSYKDLITLFQTSSAHVYLSAPFVLSWSMLEAMSAGCLIIGSDTPPVTEVITDGENGLLVDFFSPKQIAEKLNEVLDKPNNFQKIRQRARETILQRYDFKNLLPKQVKLIKDVAARNFPKPGIL